MGPVLFQSPALSNRNKGNYSYVELCAMENDRYEAFQGHNGLDGTPIDKDTAFTRFVRFACAPCTSRSTEPHGEVDSLCVSFFVFK